MAAPTQSSSRADPDFKHQRLMNIALTGRIALAGAVCALLNACSSLPSAGPSTRDIDKEYRRTQVPPFELIDISEATIEVLNRRREASLAARFGDYRGAPDLIIGVGDSLSVNIFEAGSNGLFSPAPQATTTGAPAALSIRGAAFPEQLVGKDGCISVPFAGRVPVAGGTPVQAQAAIGKALAGKTENPQVLVGITRNASNTVTVVGEVTAGARVPLSSRGDRVLDVLAAVGGVRVPTYETEIQLTRGEVTVKLPLPRVLEDPRENIYLRPDDNLVLTRRPETFTAFGATGRNAVINFDAAKVNLIEAVAKSGGLLDARADPRGVYLFRFEPRDLAAALGAPLPKLPASVPVPVVYQLDLTQAGGYFLARNFAMRDGDVLYVSNARSNQLEKFLQLLSLITQPIIQGAVLNNGFK